MAGTVTTYGNDDRAIERDPIILTFDYEAEVGLTKSEEAVLRSMPAGIKYLWCQIQCIRADAGTATSQLSLDHGATEIFTGTADNGAAVNTIDGGTAGSDGAFLAAAAETAGATAGNLIASFTATGTTTTAAKYRILVCCFRPTF